MGFITKYWLVKDYELNIKLVCESKCIKCFIIFYNSSFCYKKKRPVFTFSLQYKVTHQSLVYLLVIVNKGEVKKILFLIVCNNTFIWHLLCLLIWFIDLIFHRHKPSFVNLSFPLWDIHQRWRWASGNCSKEFWLKTRGYRQVSRIKTNFSADFKIVQYDMLMGMFSVCILLQAAWSEKTHFSENCQLWTFWKRGFSVGEAEEIGALVF